MLVAGGAGQELRALERRLPPAFEPPGAAVPECRSGIAFNIIDSDQCADPRRGLSSRSPPTRCSSARARSCTSASAASASRAISRSTCSVRFKPFYLIVEIQARVVAEGRRRRRVQHRHRLHALGARRRGARAATARSACCSSRSARASTRRWGEVSVTSLPPIAVVPLLLEELAAGRELAGTAAAAERPARLAAEARLPGDDARAASARRARDQPERRCRSASRSTGSASSALGREQVLARRDRRAVREAARRRPRLRAGAVPQHERRGEAVARPAFQEQPSGLDCRCRRAGLRTGHAVKRSVRYEVTTIDTLYRRFAAASQHRRRRFVRPSRRGRGGRAEQPLEASARSRSSRSTTASRSAAERFAIVVRHGTTAGARHRELRQRGRSERVAAQEPRPTIRTLRRRSAGRARVRDGEAA